MGIPDSASNGSMPHRSSKPRCRAPPGFADHRPPQTERTFQLVPTDPREFTPWMCSSGRRFPVSGALKKDSWMCEECLKMKLNGKIHPCMYAPNTKQSKWREDLACCPSKIHRNPAAEGSDKMCQGCWT